MARLPDPLDFMKLLTPAGVQKLAQTRMSDLVLRESVRARARVSKLQERYPSAAARELAQRLIDDKKQLAGMIGGVTGVFGLLGLPADLVVMAFLQVSLLTEIATLHKVNLKTESARRELLDVFALANGVSPLTRAGPRLLGRVAGVVLEAGGARTFGRALPLVAAPVTAWLNNQHVQRVGEHAQRHYEGFVKAHAKASGTGRS